MNDVSVTLSSYTYGTRRSPFSAALTLIPDSECNALVSIGESPRPFPTYKNVPSSELASQGGRSRNDRVSPDAHALSLAKKYISTSFRFSIEQTLRVISTRSRSGNFFSRFDFKRVDKEFSDVRNNIPGGASYCGTS